MFCPWVANISATLSYVSGITAGMLVYWFNQPQAEFTKLLSVSTESCASNITMTPEVEVYNDSDETTFQISYIYISTIGLFVTIIFANLISLVDALPMEEQREKYLYS